MGRIRYLGIDSDSSGSSRSSIPVSTHPRQNESSSSGIQYTSTPRRENVRARPSTSASQKRKRNGRAINSRNSGTGPSVSVNVTRDREISAMTKRRKKITTGNNVRLLKEIRRLQASTRLLLPKTSFGRLVKEITMEITHGDMFRYQSIALEALQEAAEYYIVSKFEKGLLLAHHAKRVTLMQPDLKLLERLL